MPFYNKKIQQYFLHSSTSNILVPKPGAGRLRRVVTSRLLYNDQSFSFQQFLFRYRVTPHFLSKFKLITNHYLLSAIYLFYLWSSIFFFFSCFFRICYTAVKYCHYTDCIVIFISTINPRKAKAAFIDQ